MTTFTAATLVTVDLAARAKERIEQTALDAGEDRLRLGIAEAAVELDHVRAVLGEHEPGVEAAGERRPAARELAQDGAVDRLEDLVDGRRVGNRRERSHAAGVRAGVPVADRLVVAGCGQRDYLVSGRDREHRELRPLEQLLDVERLPERLCGAQCRVELRLVAADPDALAGGEPVGLHDARRPRDGEHARRRNAGRLHHLLRERLRPFDPRRRRARAEDGDAAAAQPIGEADDERRLRADDDEVDAELGGERDDRGRILRARRMALREGRDPRISRRGVQLDVVGACERPREGMLATARPDDEHLHGGDRILGRWTLLRTRRPRSTSSGSPTA